MYQQWCGPCRAVVSLLRKIKNELGDDLLHFATVRRVNKKYEELKIFREGPLKLCVCVCVLVQAEADSIDVLERYRGKCEPTFLFYGVSVCLCVSLATLLGILIQLLSNTTM